MYIEATITTINNLEQRFPKCPDPKVCVMLHVWYVAKSFEIGIHLFFYNIFNIRFLSNIIPTYKIIHTYFRYKIRVNDAVFSVQVYNYIVHLLLG